MDAEKIHRDKAAAQLAEWRAKIDEMKAKVAKVDADARIGLQRELDDLEQRFERARAEVDDASDSARDALAELKRGVDGAWSSISRSIERAKAKVA